MNKEELQTLRTRILAGETPSMDSFRDAISSLRENRTNAIKKAPKAKKEAKKDVKSPLLDDLFMEGRK